MRRSRLVMSLLLLSAPALAQSTALPTTSPDDPSTGTWVGAFAALNVGLVGADLQVGRSYSFIAGNAGIPMLLAGDFGAFALGSGVAVRLSSPGESVWVLDIFGLINPGWHTRSVSCDMSGCAAEKAPYLGLGVGIGFRYLHWSGFTFGLKAPIFGGAINASSTDTAASSADAVSLFFLSNLVALPIVSVGYRW